MHLGIALVLLVLNLDFDHNIRLKRDGGRADTISFVTNGGVLKIDNLNAVDKQLGILRSNQYVWLFRNAIPSCEKWSGQ